MPSLVEVREELNAKRKQLFDIFAEAGPERDFSKVTLLDGSTTEQKLAEVRRRNDEIDALGHQFDSLSLADMIGKQNEQEYERTNRPLAIPPFGGNGSGAPAGQHDSARGTLKGYLKEHSGYREFRGGQRSSVNLDFPSTDFKTLITLTTVSPQNMRRPDPINMALEERTIADLMLQGTTDRGIVEYYEETTVTNAAVTVAEGVAKPESALAWTLRTETMRKIATWIPATKESLDDVSWLESQIRGRLAFMVRRVEEAQLLTGGGTGTDLTGLVNRSGIQTQAMGADTALDAIYKGMQLVRGSAGAGFAEPTAVVLHPNDWTAMKLSKTLDGIYLWGNPSDEGPDRVWGLPVRQTTGITEGTGLVGAFRPHAEVIRREGLTVTLSSEHASYFIENKVAILAESRLGLAVYRPSAFATITGI